MSKFPIKTYDITVHLLENKLSQDERTAYLQQWMSMNCDKWVFQLEEGKETKRKHYQLRIRWKTKTRGTQVTQNLLDAIGKWGTCHVSPTSTNASKTFDYVLKADTRVAGPWADNDTSTNEKLDSAMPEDVKLCKSIPYPWQTRMTNMIDAYKPDVYIHMIIDPLGMNGKSTWTKTMFWTNRACVVPNLGECDKIMGFVCSMPRSNCYIIDIPRTMTINNTKNLVTSIENLKAGYVYDWRYHAKFNVISNPMIVITCNWNFPSDAFTTKRVIKWLIVDKKLKYFTDEKYNELQETYKTDQVNVQAGDVPFKEDE